MNPIPAARLKKARINLLMDEPFFGSLMMQLRPVEDKTVPTFRTNGDKLWYNPDYMATLNDGQLRTLLAHEVMHPALLHPFRVGNRDLRTANIAADYAVNGILDDYNKAAKAKGELEPFPWPLRPDGECELYLDHQYDGMSFEEIYAALISKPTCANGNEPQPSCGQQSGIGDGQPQQSPPDQYDGDPQAPSSPGEFCQGAVDEANAQEQEAKWKVALKQAATMAKSQGRLPASMDRVINELLDPQTSWRQVLRTMLTSVCKDDFSWSRPNTRYMGRGMILPSLHSPRLGRIVVAIDTSGSIGQKELDEFMAEIRGIMFDCRPEKLVIVQCDAKIHEWTELDPFDELEVTLKGGGGTDFRPVFDRLAEETESIAALVYLTDLAGTFPDEQPPYPVIWACNNDDQGPFGETVKI